MPIEQTLARVEAELARGETAMARQRLRGLIGSYPHRLDLRERLAQVYRDGGDLAQAGRWSYLSENTIAAEQQAFTRLYCDDALRMMVMLAWRGTEDDAPTAIARARLTELRKAAERQSGGPVTWDNPVPPVRESGRRERVTLYLVGLLFASVVILGVIGALAAVINGIRVVWGWFS